MLVKRVKRVCVGIDSKNNQMVKGIYVDADILGQVVPTDIIVGEEPEDELEANGEDNEETSSVDSRSDDFIYSISYDMADSQTIVDVEKVKFEVVTVCDKNALFASDGTKGVTPGKITDPLVISSTITFSIPGRMKKQILRLARESLEKKESFGMLLMISQTSGKHLESNSNVGYGNFTNVFDVLCKSNFDKYLSFSHDDSKRPSIYKLEEYIFGQYYQEMKVIRDCVVDVITNSVVPKMNSSVVKYLGRSKGLSKNVYGKIIPKNFSSFNIKRKRKNFEEDASDHPSYAPNRASSLKKSSA